MTQILGNAHYKRIDMCLDSTRSLQQSAAQALPTCLSGNHMFSLPEDCHWLHNTYMQTDKGNYLDNPYPHTWGGMRFAPSICHTSHLPAVLPPLPH